MKVLFFILFIILPACKAFPPLEKEESIQVFSLPLLLSIDSNYQSHVDIDSNKVEYERWKDAKLKGSHQSLNKDFKMIYYQNQFQLLKDQNIIISAGTFQNIHKSQTIAKMQEIYQIQSLLQVNKTEEKNQILQILIFFPQIIFNSPIKLFSEQSLNLLSISIVEKDFNFFLFISSPNSSILQLIQKINFSYCTTIKDHKFRFLSPFYENKNNIIIANNSIQDEIRLSKIEITDENTSIRLIEYQQAIVENQAFLKSNHNLRILTNPDPNCFRVDGSGICIQCNSAYPYLLGNNCYNSYPAESFCHSLFDTQNSYVCLKCGDGCLDCDFSLNCLKCLNPTDFLYQGRCRILQPLNTYCDINCVDCDPTCSSCSPPIIKIQFQLNASTCLTCQQDFPYLYNSQCSKVQPPQTYCQQSMIVNSQKDCISCPQGCSSCDQSQNCLSCLASLIFLYQQKCTYYQPQNAYCNINKECFPCNKACESCTGPTIRECQSCKIGYILKESTCSCIQKQFYYNLSLEMCMLKKFDTSKDSEQAIYDSFNYLRDIGLSATLFATLVQGSNNKVISFFSFAATIQKIFYLQMMNLDIPYFLFKAENNLASKGIIPSYNSKFNLLRTLTGDGGGKTIGYKFKQVNFQACIFENSGGAFIHLFLGISLMALILALVKTKFKNKVLMIFEKVISGWIVSSLQVLVLVFYFSFFQGIIVVQEDSNELTFLEYIMIILSLIIASTILIAELILLKRVIIKLYKLDYYRCEDQEKNLFTLFMDKLYFNCITENLSTCTYILTFTIIECIIFPIIVIFFRMNFQDAILQMIILQTIEGGITLYLRPFLSQIQNISFILEQVLFTIVFFLTLVLSFHLEDDASDDMNFSSSVQNLSFVIALILCFIAMINPAIQIFNILCTLFSAVKGKILLRQKKEEAINSLTEMSFIDIKDETMKETHNELKISTIDQSHIVATQNLQVKRLK